MQFGWKEVQEVNEASFDKRHLSFLLVKDIRIDDTGIDTPEIEQRIYVLRSTARHDREDVKLALLVHETGDFCREAKRRAFNKAAAGETDGPCIGALLSWPLLPSRPQQPLRAFGMIGRGQPFEAQAASMQSWTRPL